MDVNIVISVVIFSCVVIAVLILARKSTKVETVFQEETPAPPFSDSKCVPERKVKNGGFMRYYFFPFFLVSWASWLLPQITFTLLEKKPLVVKISQSSYEHLNIKVGQNSYESFKIDAKIEPKYGTEFNVRNR